jgi:hypothetical protein
MLPFFTTTYEIPAERVYRVFLASTDGFDRVVQPEEVFDRIYGDRRVSLDEIASSLTTDSVPGIVEAILDVLPAYAAYDGNIGLTDFRQLLLDLFSSAPSQYNNILNAVWNWNK